MRYSDYLSKNSCAIFLMHGVIKSQAHSLRNYTRKHLLLDEFVAILTDLTACGHAVSMSEVMLATEENPLPENAFAFTFDDGFENNASVAAPALVDFQVPATFYVTSGFIGNGGRSWTDMIEAALEGVSKLQLKGINPFIDGTYAGPSEKRALMERVRTYVKGTSDIDPYQFAGEFIQQCGVTDIPFDKDLDEKLSWKQVRELSDHPLFTIGGHGHTHRILSHLSSSDLESEISTSIEILEAATGKPVHHYSYPEGLTNCFSEEVINCLKRHGVLCCPTAEHGLNTTGTDLFRLRRIFVL